MNKKHDKRRVPLATKEDYDELMRILSGAEWKECCDNPMSFEDPKKQSKRLSSAKSNRND